MRTLKITIDNDKHAILLEEMLKSVHFVKRIETEKNDFEKLYSQAYSQYFNLKKTA